MVSPSRVVVFIGGAGSRSIVAAWRTRVASSRSYSSAHSAFSPVTNPATSGLPGALGRNTLQRADGTKETLPGKVQFVEQPGDVLTIETPGGGPAGRQMAGSRL